MTKPVVVGCDQWVATIGGGKYEINPEIDDFDDSKNGEAWAFYEYLGDFDMNWITIQIDRECDDSKSQRYKVTIDDRSLVLDSFSETYTFLRGYNVGRLDEAHWAKR
jgi:hypothetical protein